MVGLFVSVEERTLLGPGERLALKTRDSSLTLSFSLCHSLFSSSFILSSLPPCLSLLLLNILVSFSFYLSSYLSPSHTHTNSGKCTTLFPSLLDMFGCGGHRGALSAGMKSLQQSVWEMEPNMMKTVCVCLCANNMCACVFYVSVCACVCVSSTMNFALASKKPVGQGWLWVKLYVLMKVFVGRRGGHICGSSNPPGPEETQTDQLCAGLGGWGGCGGLVKVTRLSPTT